MKKGIVKWFDNKRGYGFILRDEESDLFVHYTGIEGEGYKKLFAGDLVEYEVTIADDGRPMATGVRVLRARRVRYGRKRSSS